MKTFVACVLILVSTMSNGQAISLRAGHSLSPADHFSLRYEHWTNGAVNFSLGGFMERSRKNLLNYSCYGADLLAEYVNNRSAEPLPCFGLRYGLGGTWQIENEPWLYKGLSFTQRMNYGLLAETSLDYNATANFRVIIYGQQKFLFRSIPHASKLCFGLGLAYHLDSY